MGAVPLLARPLPSHAPGHLVGCLRLTLETTCSPLLSGQSFKCGTFWNVFSATEACIYHPLVYLSLKINKARGWNQAFLQESPRKDA